MGIADPKTLNSVTIPALFIPACFILYNDSALVYVPVYLVVLAIGQGIGSIIKFAIEKKAQNSMRGILLFTSRCRCLRSI